MEAGRSKILHLYRTLLRTGYGYKDFNLRSYIIRKAKEDFGQIKTEKDQAKVTAFYNEMQQYLELVKRQQTVQNLYSSRKSILDPK